jgi:signal transduction histidine kinase
LQIPQDEQETVWDWNLIPILDKEKQDKIRFMLVSATEITEQVQARQEVERLNHLKDEFLSLASHELRNPLTSIMGNTELLKRGLKRLSKSEVAETPKLSLEREEHLLDSITHQTQRLANLIDEMLDITRIRSEQFELKNRENVNIVQLVRQAVEQQSAISNHPIILETQQEEILVTCDEARIEQVLNNLMSNAIKYSPADKPVVVGIERNDQEVIISVRDQGDGISQEEQAHVFERFYRVHTDENARIEGLGLGLYIAHEIVVQQGGRMWLESKPGQGSTFYFSLPLPKKEK